MNVSKLVVFLILLLLIVTGIYLIFSINANTNEKIQFGLDKISFNPNKQSESLVFTADFNSDYNLTYISSNLVSLSFEDGEILVATTAGEGAGLFNNVSLNNRLKAFDKEILSVNIENSNLPISTDIDYKNIVFYSDSFKFNEDCEVLESTVNGCGRQDLLIDKENFLTIICGFNNEAALYKCNTFVESLRIK